MKKRTFILIIVILIMLLGTIFGIVDYRRIKSGEMPLFMIRITDGSKSIHHYIGLGYRLERVTGVSYKQPIYADTEVKFGLWFFVKKVNVKSSNIDNSELNSTGTAEYLFNLKTEYIGDNSAVGKLLEVLDLRMYGQYTFELKTSEKPYALIINYNQIEGWGNILNNPETVIEKSAILLALIDNADEIHWLPDNNEIHKISTSDLLDKYGNIKGYGKSAEDLKQLLIKLGYYEEDEPITIDIENLTNAGLTLVLKNHTNSNYLYGDPYGLQRKENDKWVEVEQIADNCAFNMIGYTLREKQEIETKINWEYCYGKLPAGQYRITKDFDHVISELSELSSKFGKNHIISAEFII